ncbi:hypothetical protein EJ06DRAFT_525636 [Trichodelitschia bisporula]|uniref:Uncharacterized protein n=1 Tax=Trichodelitschia bisporula TaxID=703511 RepID=A0A6G1I9W9_9PEZI|nr:hypothetical protein EJ06DRAFT_525636 [Trichodelitschia bisporula]
MHFSSVLIFILSMLSFVVAMPRNAAKAVQKAKLETDLNIIIPARRNRFHWDVSRPTTNQTVCECTPAYCPVSLIDSQSIVHCRNAHAYACWRSSGGACPKPGL